MAERKIDYKKLVANGQIKSLPQLLAVFRKEVIDIYRETPCWEDYRPTEREKREFGRIYLSMDLCLEVPFSVFIQMSKRKFR
jgi:hypothetical protein